MKKYIIINILLSVAILFSVLFQSIHSYEHHSENIQTKHCKHPDSKNKTEFTHTHSTLEKCFTCNFSFNSFSIPEFSVIEFKTTADAKYLICNFSAEIAMFFKGCIFSLRAPPLV